MAGRLAGKVCVITGTGGSMGRATALLFARAGAPVVGCDVTAEPAAATVGMVRAVGGAGSWSGTSGRASPTPAPPAAPPVPHPRPARAGR